jgi:hypothetical protein
MVLPWFENSYPVPSIDNKLGCPVRHMNSSYLSFPFLFKYLEWNYLDSCAAVLVRSSKVHSAISLHEMGLHCFKMDPFCPQCRLNDEELMGCADF